MSDVSLNNLDQQHMFLSFEEKNTDCLIIASVTTGVVTGSRRVKPKDVRDRVSEASWPALLGDQYDTVILSALVWGL